MMTKKEAAEKIRGCKSIGLIDTGEIHEYIEAAEVLADAELEEEDHSERICTKNDLNTLQVGDIIYDPEGRERRIIGVLDSSPHNRVYAVSDWCNDRLRSKVGLVESANELRIIGYTITTKE